MTQPDPSPDDTPAPYTPPAGVLPAHQTVHADGYPTPTDNSPRPEDGDQDQIEGLA